MPEVTVWFWITKVLCTTVGETAADLSNGKAGLGLTGVSVLMSALLAFVLVCVGSPPAMTFAHRLPGAERLAGQHCATARHSRLKAPRLCHGRRMREVEP